MYGIIILDRLNIINEIMQRDSSGRVNLSFLITVFLLFLPVVAVVVVVIHSPSPVCTLEFLPLCFLCSDL